MNRGLLRIQCTRCPAFLTAQRTTREEFGAALEERGWRVTTDKASARAVCPDCAKPMAPEELALPKHAGVTA